MKYLLTLLLAMWLCTPSLFAQDEEDDYHMVSTVYLTPAPGTDFAALADKMHEHNKNFHSPDNPAFASTVFHVASGPDVGKIVWMMGPHKYADLGNRPSGEAHDSDWAKVGAHFVNVENGEFWRRDKKLSNDVGNPADYPLVMVRFNEVAKGQGHRIDGVLEKLSNTIKSMDDRRWLVYWNELRQGYKIGRHVAIVIPMRSWADMDDNWEFKKHFEEVNGEGSMIAWQREMEEVFADGYDEIWEVDPYMSGMAEDDGN